MVYQIDNANKSNSDEMGKKVLLVSHPGNMHNVLLKVLRSMPNTTIMDTNGALSAYGIFENEGVDVIITDANIPISERLALISRVKAHRPQTLCLVLTGTSKNHDLLREAGASPILLHEASPQAMKTVIFPAG